SALAILSGAGVAALFFCLVPPLSPAFRARRLLTLTLRDLRHLAFERTFDDWAGHIHSRFSAMPVEPTPLQRAQMLATLWLGSELIRLRPAARQLGLDAPLDNALAAIAQGNSATAIMRLTHVDEALASHTDSDVEAMRARASILAMSEVLTQ